MRLLGLDIGEKRTGIAFFDDAVGIVMPLDTIAHQSIDELATKVVEIARARDASHVVVGYPLLLSGEKGAQVKFVEEVTKRFELSNLPFTLLDERFTTPHSPLGDPDAQAACVLLRLFLERGVDK